VRIHFLKARDDCHCLFWVTNDGNDEKDGGDAKNQDKHGGDDVKKQ
jgi:hypothetical protein